MSDPGMNEDDVEQRWKGFVRLMQFCILLLYPVSFVVIVLSPQVAGWVGREMIEFVYAPILGALRYFGVI